MIRTKILRDWSLDDLICMWTRMLKSDVSETWLKEDFEEALRLAKGPELSSVWGELFELASQALDED